MVTLSPSGTYQSSRSEQSGAGYTIATAYLNYKTHTHTLQFAKLAAR